LKVDKYISQNGYCSRRKAFDLIEEKRVVVNKKIATFSTKIIDGDLVEIDGKPLIEKEFIPTYIAYNKPKGVICTSESLKNNIITAINHPQKIYPVGRLDKDSEGLILLTNVTSLIDKIANPKFEHEKEYVVTLNLPLTKPFIKEVENGMVIGGEVSTNPCLITPSIESKRIFNIVLKQGLNRQIRKMCNKHNYNVLKLQRVRVLNILLGKLKLGEWRNLTEQEVLDITK
jgi:23S rRNA pseudouridine2604 synthase